MSQQLAGKVALVTGGSRGAKALAIEADSADPDAVKKAVVQTVTELGRLDILVNNAGILIRDTVDQYRLADFDKMIAVNVRAVFVGIQAASWTAHRKPTSCSAGCQRRSSTDCSPRASASITIVGSRASSAWSHPSPPNKRTWTICSRLRERWRHNDPPEAQRSASELRPPRFELRFGSAGKVIDHVHRKQTVASRWHAVLRSHGVTEKDCTLLARAFVYPGFELPATNTPP
jgi:short chain dehydrogenase